MNLDGCGELCDGEAAKGEGERGRTAAVTAAAAVEIYSMTNDEGALRQRGAGAGEVG